MVNIVIQVKKLIAVAYFQFKSDISFLGKLCKKQWLIVIITKIFDAHTFFLKTNLIECYHLLI